MRRLGLLAYLSVLLLSLAAAYLTWTREPAKPGEKVPLLSCRKGDLVGLEFRSKSRTVLFSPKRSSYSGKSFWWVDITTRPAGENQEGKAQSGEPKIEVFKADAKMDEALGRFCPWMILRDLGRIGDEKRQEFGLADSADRLVLKFKAGERPFRLGTTLSGHPDRYLEDEQSGEIYLVPGQDIREIEHPKSRYMERGLHGFGQDQAIRIRLRAGEREKELVAKLSDEGKSTGWADSSRPEEEKELYKNWIQKYFALRVLEYLVPPEKAESMGCSGRLDADPVLTLTFYDREKEIGFSTFYKPSGKDKDGDLQYSVCTDNTDCLVSLPKSQVEGLLQDLEEILSDS